MAAAEPPGGPREPGVERWCAEIASSTSALALIIDGADLTQPVPTCPDWTLRQLITHVGRAQRWAAEIVATASPVPIPFREVPDGRLPDDPGQHAQWLRSGAARLTQEVTAGSATPVWAFGQMRPAAFWARRMAHETAVHRADAQLATGHRPVIDAGIAVDGIDEWLNVLLAPQPGEADRRAGVLAGGRVLHIHATDVPTAGAGEWLIRSGPAGVVVAPGHGRGDVAVRGTACDLLLLLVRRLPPGDSGIEIIGDASLLDAWLAATPF